MKTVEITMPDEAHAELLRIAERTGSVALSGRKTGQPPVGRLISRIARHEIWVKEARHPRKAARKKPSAPERPSWFREGGMPVSEMSLKQIERCKERGFQEEDGFYSFDGPVPDLPTEQHGNGEEAYEDWDSENFNEIVKEVLP